MPRPSRYSRQESLEKAITLFWQRGFHATSLKDLERALDLRPGSIYATFGSKEELFAEALEQYTQRAMRELENTLAANPSPLGGLSDYLRVVGLRMCEDRAPSRGCMLVRSLLEFGELGGPRPVQADQLLARMEQCFIEQFESARSQGEIPVAADPERLGCWMQTQVMGLRAFAQRPVSAQVVRELSEDLAAEVARRGQTHAGNGQASAAGWGARG